MAPLTVSADRAGLRCRDPSLTTSVECVRLEQRIVDTVRQFGFRHVSFDSELFPWVRDSADLSRLSALTWKLSEIIQRSNLNFVRQETLPEKRDIPGADAVKILVGTIRLLWACGIQNALTR